MTTEIRDAYSYYELLKGQGKCNSLEEFLPYAQCIYSLCQDMDTEWSRAVAKDFGAFLRSMKRLSQPEQHYVDLQPGPQTPPTGKKDKRRSGWYTSR